MHQDQLPREQADRATRMASLLRASRAITSSLIFEEVLDTVAREVVGALESFYCVIWEHMPEEDALMERAAYQVGDSYSPLGEVLKLSEHAIERMILNGAVPVLETVSDPELDPASRASMEKWGEQTCLSLPLRFGDEPLGVLVIGETERERRFTADELELAEGLAIQASVAMHNALTYRRLASRNEELVAHARRERLLNELSLELSSSLDVGKVLESAARQISTILDASGCDIYSCEDEDTLVCQAACADGEIVEEWAGARFSLEEWTASRRAIEERASVVIASLDDPRLGAQERADMQKWDERAVFITPMEARGRILGTLEIVQTGRERVFTPEEIATAEACARMAALAIDNATLYQRQADHAQQLSSLLEAGRAITSSLVIRDVLDALVRTAATTLNCPEALIFEYDADADTLTMRSAFQDRPTVYEDLDKPYAVADYPSDRELLVTREVVVETISDLTLPADVRESMEYHGEKTCLTVPLSFGEESLGMLTLIETAAERVFADTELEFARGLGEQAAMAMRNARLFENVKGLHLGHLKALSSALTAKDYYTIGHTARVAAYAVLLAGELGWSEREIQQLEEATYLHDIGKIAVADRVLLKSGALTDEEWALMKQHPTISAEIIEALLDDGYVAGVRHHHERYGGGGYPDGLSGDEIPEVARLLCVVDSYDAMSSRRVYRRARTYEECLRELQECCGTQFDPVMVDAFVSVLEKMDVRRQALEAAAAEAAARINAADHVALQGPEDRERPEYARILATLRETRRAHPLVETMVSEARVDELRCMIVVDSDQDEETALTTGEVAFSDDLEIETFAGRPHDTNVVFVDSWGTWLSATAPIRDAEGMVVGLVSASKAPWEGLRSNAFPSAVSDTFAGMMRSAAARQTRAEIESMTDALTGLCNHRHFQESLREQVDAALLDNRDLALLFCDIDHFKLLNDRHGHMVGDDVLRRAGQVLAAAIRRGDVAARYGGDEFAVVLLDADATHAWEVAERIRQRVGELRVGPGAEFASVSIGLANLPGDGASSEELLASADRAMYAAKERGRDCVVRAGSAGAGSRPAR
jgi:diguanylate cyclase (GGDEF)-like protein